MIALKKYKFYLKRAASTLKNGGVIICPTDTVYGFLADAGNKKAVEEIYKIKKRARSKPLPVFVKDLKMAKEIAEIDPPSSASRRTTKEQGVRREKILRKYWPGKYTFVLLRKRYKKGSFTNSIELVNGVSARKLYGVGEKTIALRIPKYKFLNDLLKKINRPLAQTSVNISGEPPLTKIEDIKTRFTQNHGRSGATPNLVRSDLTKFLLLIIDGGDLKRAKPSKIIDLTADKRTIVRT